MRILNFKKKGALNLSINAIVVLIIAIVFLGLALTFTRTLISDSTIKLRQGIKNVDITTPADSSDTLKVYAPDELKLGKNHEMKFSFYNNDASARNVTPVMSCKDSYNNDVNQGLTFVSTDIAVQGYQEQRFTALIGLDITGDYICTVTLKDGGSSLAFEQLTFKVIP